MDDIDKLSSTDIPKEDDITCGEIMQIYKSTKDPVIWITRAFILGYMRGKRTKQPIIGTRRTRVPIYVILPFERVIIMGNSIEFSVDLTAAEIEALSRLFYATTDRSSGLWKVIIHSFQLGVLKAQKRPQKQKQGVSVMDTPYLIFTEDPFDQEPS